LYFSFFFSHPLLLLSALCFTLSYPFSNTLFLHILLFSLRFFLRSHFFLFFQSTIHPFFVTICHVPDSRHDIGKHRFTGDNPWLHGSNRLPSDPQNPSSCEVIIIVVDFYCLSVRESGCSKRFLSPCSPIPTTIKLSH